MNLGDERSVEQDSSDRGHGLDAVPGAPHGRATRRRGVRLLVSVGLGVLGAFAFPPWSWFWALPLALALWWVWLAREVQKGRYEAPIESSSGDRSSLGARARWTFRAGFWPGLGFGLGLFGAGVHWVFHSLLIFGEAPLVVASLATILLVVGLALYVALATATSLAVMQVLVGPRVPPGLSLLVLGSAWLAAEMARMHWFSGFPWLLTGHVVLDSPLEPWLSLAGEMGAGWGVVVLVMAVAFLALGRWRLRLTGAALAVVVVASALLFDGTGDLRPDGDAVSIGIVQGNIPQDEKWSEDGVERALETYVAMSEPLVGVDVIVWPETAIPDFYFQVFGPLEAVALTWLESGSELATGVFDYDPVEGRMYNSIRHVVSGGVYDKRHLVPFGEFMPMRSLLGWLDGVLGIPMSDLSPGRGDGLLEIAGTPMGLSICYESAFSQAMSAPLPAAAMLLNVSNDAWFGDSAAPRQHLAIARIRSIELGRPMIRATNTGISALIDHRGRVLSQTGLFETATLSGTLQPIAGSTLAFAVGASVARWLAATTWPILMLVMLVTLGLRARREARPR
ncbi:MAG: apolipoprotein N-acyltransferase [Thioalkalivibrionaceae bacterium]